VVNVFYGQTVCLDLGNAQRTLHAVHRGELHRDELRILGFQYGGELAFKQLNLVAVRRDHADGANGVGKFVAVAVAAFPCVSFDS